MNGFDDGELPLAFAQPDAHSGTIEPLKEVDQMHEVRVPRGPFAMRSFPKSEGAQLRKRGNRVSALSR